MSYQQEKFKEIADKIREKTGTTDLIKPNQFVNKVDEIFEIGKKAEYDRFWDTFQNKGARTKYHYAFMGWNDEVFQPKYDMQTTSAVQMFQNFNRNDMGSERLSSLPEMLAKTGVTIDFSNCTSFSYFANYAYITDFGFIDTSKASNLNNFLLNASRMLSVSLKLKIDGSQIISSTTFQNCNKLVNLTITEGLIGNDVSFQWSPLSVDSMKNIISHLKIYAGTSEDRTKTITFSSACWEALEASGRPQGGAPTWRDYVNAFYGWNV